MVHLIIPSLPPSSNHAYANIRGTNKRVLTKEGKAYKTLTTMHLTRVFSSEMLYFKKDKPYLLMVRFYFPSGELKTKGWPKAAESRYKKVDVGNRLKLLEDALKDAGGIDDSQNFILVLQKLQAEGDKGRTEIWAWNLEEEETPFNEALLELC